MAEIRDMIGSFELYQPMEVGLRGALDLLRGHGASAWVLSGGMDTFDWLKDRPKRPEVVVVLGAIAELKGISLNGDGIRIGSMTSLSEVVRHPEASTRFPVLARAAQEVATLQIRNQGTMGDILRRTCVVGMMKTDGPTAGRARTRATRKRLGR